MRTAAVRASVSANLSGQNNPNKTFPLVDLARCDQYRHDRCADHSAGRFSPQRFSAPKGGLPPKPSGNLEWLEDLEIYT
jgi:hypothetical protein